jgi:hypothetical protein
MAEVLGWRHSLNDAPTRATGFYSLAVLNACLLPIVLGLLLVLERRALPTATRMTGIRRITTYLLTGIVIAFGLFTAVQTLFFPNL